MLIFFAVPLVNHLIDFLKIILIELLLCWLENVLQNFVNFSKMTHLNHPIGLVNHQILQIAKIKHFLAQQLVQPTRSSNHNLWLSALQYSQLLLFGHSSNNAGDFYAIDWRLSFVDLAEC
jgi:hypothetical protein